VALLAEGGDPYEQAIAEMGEFFPVGDRPRPKGMRKMADKDCYSNASHRIDTHGLVYGEGFAVSSSGFIVHHAWNLDADGVVVERWEVGHAYFGVRRNSVSHARKWWSATGSGRERSSDSTGPIGGTRTETTTMPTNAYPRAYGRKPERREYLSRRHRARRFSPGEEV
jgi:hypothetical protein